AGVHFGAQTGQRLLDRRGQRLDRSAAVMPLLGGVAQREQAAGGGGRLALRRREHAHRARRVRHRHPYDVGAHTICSAAVGALMSPRSIASRTTETIAAWAASTSDSGV